jgi:gas vesicle protein
VPDPKFSTNHGENTLVKNKQESNNVEMIFTLLVGALAGSLTMLLLAPQSGKRTRQKIQDKGVEIRDNTTDMVEGALALSWLARNKLARDARRKTKELIRQGQAVLSDKMDDATRAAKAGKSALQRSIA